MHIEANDNIKRNNARIQELFGIMPRMTLTKSMDCEDEDELAKACGDKPMMKADEDELGEQKDEKDMSDEELKEKMEKLSADKTRIEMGAAKQRSVLKQDM